MGPTGCWNAPTIWECSVSAIPQLAEPFALRHTRTHCRQGFLPVLGHRWQPSRWPPPGLAYAAGPKADLPLSLKLFDGLALTSAFMSDGEAGKVVVYRYVVLRDSGFGPTAFAGLRCGHPRSPGRLLHRRGYRCSSGSNHSSTPLVLIKRLASCRSLHCGAMIRLLGPPVTRSACAMSLPRCRTSCAASLSRRDRGRSRTP
jgi:hypothetical protein